MAISIPLITTFDAKGINRAITQFKRLDGGVNKSAFVLKNLNQATSNAFRSIAKVGAGVAFGAGLIGKALVSQAMEAKKVTAQTNAIIKATGGSARISAKGVGELSDKLSMQIGIDDELIQKSANLLLTFKQVQNVLGEGNDIFNRAVTTAQDLGNVFGSAESGAMQLGKALSDPIAGITALRRAGINFSAQQKEQIKTLVQSGKTLEAQKLILDEVESQVGGTAEATATDFGRMQVAIENVAEQLGTLLLPYLEDFANFVTETIVPVLTEFGDIVGEEGLGAGVKFLGGELLNVITALDGWALGIYAIVTAFIALKVAVGLATVATTLFGVALASTGVGLIIIAISLVIVALVSLTLKFQGFRDFFVDLWNGIVGFFQFIINKLLGALNDFVNIFVRIFNFVIDKFNKLTAVFGGTPIKPFEEVNFQLNIMGALIDSNTKKAIIMANTINDHIQGTGRGGSRRSPEYGTSPNGLKPPPIPTFTGDASKTVKTMQERFADLVAELQGYGKQLRAVKDAHKAVLQAPKDLAIAIANTAKAQTHFNNVVNGFSVASKEAKEAVANLAQAQRDAVRSGIGLADAQQAVVEAQKALTLLQTPASARSIAEAQDAITQATYDLADANKELDRAQRRNRPRELAIAQIAQRDATNALADAQTNLTTLQADADPQAVIDAQEDLTKAQLDLIEAQNDNATATETVATAQDALNQILKGARTETDAYTEAVDLLAEAKLNEATATDAVATSIIAEKDAKLALAKAERELIMSKAGMSKKQIAKAERQTGVISGNKAVGGSVQAGKSYIVGEMGREMFTPSSNGSITPNNQMSQGSTINISINAGLVSTPAQVGQEIIKAIQQAQRRSGNVFAPA